MRETSDHVSLPSFTMGVLGSTGLSVGRLGLSASYRPGRQTVHYALDHGVNLFFSYGFDGQSIRTLRSVFPARRQEVVLVTGTYNLIWGHPGLRQTMEKRLRQFGTDYLDAFLFLGVLKPKQCPDGVIEELARFREEGKVRAAGLSTHDRKFAGKLAQDGTLNTFMIRYNAAHRGAEQDIFPYLSSHDPGLISYTAMRWGYLLRRPRGWPKERPVPAASQCYRFVLSNPNVDVCLTAAANLRQIKENLRSLEAGPLAADEMEFMREFGDAVHYRKRYFMRPVQAHRSHPPTGDRECGEAPR